MPMATTYDVSVPLLRPLTTAEEAYAARLLAWAETLIRARHPDLGLLDSEAVILVEAQAVARVLRNPDGKYQESVDDYSSMRDRIGSDGLLRITDEEWGLLSPASSSDNGGAFSIDTACTAGVHLPICSLYFGALYCSCGADLTNYEYPLFGVV